MVSSRVISLLLVAIGAGMFPGTPAHLAWAHGTATWSQADPQTEAIQASIQQSQQDKMQAVATHDPTPLRNTSTGAYYRQLLQVVRFLISGGVTSIAPTELTWGPISVDGSTATATATATESWHATFKDGTNSDASAINVYTLVQQDGTWRIEADRRVTVSAAATAPEPAPAPSAGQYTSANWSGYLAAGGGTYTGVSSTWTVPLSVTSDAGGAGSTWVGIGGVTGTDLIQAGTEAVAALGRARFEAWIETLPQVSQTVPLTVTPGDSVTVSIDEQGAGSGAWQISIVNNTTGQRYQTSVTYTSTESSAEWIQEAPTGAVGVLPLDNFQSVEFGASTTTVSGQNLNLAQAGAKSLALVNAYNQPLAEPSPLGDDGLGFTVTRTSAPATWDTGGPGDSQPSTPTP
jgi:hypothetical protein